MAESGHFEYIDPNNPDNYLRKQWGNWRFVSDDPSKGYQYFFNAPDPENGVLLDWSKARQRSDGTWFVGGSDSYAIFNPASGQITTTGQSGENGTNIMGMDVPNWMPTALKIGGGALMAGGLASLYGGLGAGATGAGGVNAGVDATMIGAETGAGTYGGASPMYASALQAGNYATDASFMPGAEAIVGSGGAGALGEAGMDLGLIDAGGLVEGAGALGEAGMDLGGSLKSFLKAAGAAASLVGAAASLAGAGASMLNPPSQPDTSASTIPKAATPASAYAYDADGNLISSQVWDPEKNAYISRQGPKTAKQLAEEAKAAAEEEARKKEKEARLAASEETERLRKIILGTIDQTPAEILASYDEYAKNFSTALHRDVDISYEDMLTRINKAMLEAQTSNDENMEKRGMTASRAAVDISNDIRQKGQEDIQHLNRDKLNTDTDIAAKAQMAKEDLGNNYRTNQLNILNALNQSSQASSALEATNKNAEANLAFQKNIANNSNVSSLAQEGLTAGNNAYNASMSAYNNNNNLNMNSYLGNLQTNQANAKNLLNTASGLAYLYGYNNNNT